MCEALGSRPVPERAGCVALRLGEGGFGTVMLVRKKNSGKLFALKMLEKSRMTKRGIADRVISESVSLQQIRHPFVVTLHYAFQDKSRVYFVHRQTGSTQWNLPPGWTSSSSGWAARVDARTGHTYYFLPSTGETTWTLPDR